jgi:hypothetical protein
MATWSDRARLEQSARYHRRTGESQGNRGEKYWTSAAKTVLELGIEWAMNYN